MILRQFLHNDPVGISYLFGCGGKATAAVVDPVGDIQPYLQAADNAGMRIHFVIDTHVHADHLSAGRALADAAGAAYVLSAETGVSFPYKGVRDGEVLPLGNVSATVLHTPGHTPEHICILVTDRTRADEPWFVFTGHTLMVGDLGRTELAVSAEEGAKQLFRSVRRLKASAGLRRGAARCLCGLGLRSPAERQALVHHRLREAAQSGVHDRGRSRVCSVHGRRDSAGAAGSREDQGRQFGPAGGRGLIP